MAPTSSEGHIDLKVKVMDLEIFNVKFFKSSYFPIYMMDFVHMIDTVPKFFFKSSYFPNHTMDFVHIWYDDRYRSKILFSNTPCPCPWPQGQS